MPTSFTDSIRLEIALRLALALLVGALIGLERSYHGRPAGFRTHALVCLSTALLMLVTVFERFWFAGIARAEGTSVTIDPTRMAQGIMTGIGFLGAGTIIKDGVSVRGLTTAASIWMTAAIGILIGIGFYWPALSASVLTLGTLSAFRWVERKIPAQYYAHLTARLRQDAPMAEPELRKLLEEHSFSIGSISYGQLGQSDDGKGALEYRVAIRGRNADRARALAETLIRHPAVAEFRIAPTGD